jgi:Rab-like protein 2
VKIILLGDSAVGKSKLVERFLMDGYQPQQLSTFALTLFRYNFAHPDGEILFFYKCLQTVVGVLTCLCVKTGRSVAVDFWDTAGQERFNNLHPSYFYRAHACVMAFDVTRKVSCRRSGRWTCWHSTWNYQFVC